MVRDDLLEQIRQPLLDRVDRRLAAILGVSIAAHLGIAIVAWMTDPPASPFFDRLAPPQEMVILDDLRQLPSMTPAAPASTARPSDPAPARAPSRTPRRGKPAPTVDVHTLVSSVIGDAGDLTDLTELSSKRPGKDLSDQLDDVKARGATARVGRDGVDPDSTLRAAPGTEPVADTGDVATSTKKRSDDPGTVKFVPPRLPPGTELDPSDDIRDRFMTGIRRCYTRHLETHPGASGRIDLDFVVDTRGRVDSAGATGSLPDVGDCVEDLALRWRFNVVLDEDTPFSIKLIFVPHAP